MGIQSEKLYISRSSIGYLRNTLCVWVCWYLFAEPLKSVIKQSTTTYKTSQIHIHISIVNTVPHPPRYASLHSSHRPIKITAQHVPIPAKWCAFWDKIPTVPNETQCPHYFFSRISRAHFQPLNQLTLAYMDNPVAKPLREQHQFTNTHTRCYSTHMLIPYIYIYMYIYSGRTQIMTASRRRIHIFFHR